MESENIETCPCCVAKLKFSHILGGKAYNYCGYGEVLNNINYEPNKVNEIVEEMKKKIKNIDRNEKEDGQDTYIKSRL